MKLTFSIPPKSLAPNARVHYMTKASAIKKHRAAVALVARIEVHNAGWKTAERARVRATFYFSTKRRRDADNLLASLKAAFDGLRDAGVINDDAGLEHQPVQVAIDKQNPRVELEVECLQR